MNNYPSRPSSLLMLTVLPALLSLSARLQASAPTISSVSLKRVACAKCSGQHGNIFVKWSSGKTTQLTANGMNAMARVAGDRRTVAWVEYTHYEGNALAKQFVVTRDAKRIRAFSINNPRVHTWGFRNNGKQIVYEAGALRVGSTFFLYDLAAGRVVAKAERNAEKLPDWTQAVTNAESSNASDPISLLNKSLAGVVWSKQPGVSIDLNGDGVKDFAQFGLKGEQIVVGIVHYPLKANSPVYRVEFGSSAEEMQSLAGIEVTLTATGISSESELSKYAKVGLVLNDEKTDPITIYWNKTEKRYQWHRN